MGACEASRRTVLYVDDHPVNILLMQALTQHRPGIQLNVASDARGGYEQAVGQHHDLLLLDLDLPDWHGLELLRRLRRLPHLQATSAIAVTADTEFELGGSGFCERWLKPLDLQATLRRLDWFLAARCRSGA